MSEEYSKTPLAKKLGIKPGNAIQIFNAPKTYTHFFVSFPLDVEIYDSNKVNHKMDFIHAFCTNEDELINYFSRAKDNLKKTGMLWISWPKKSSDIKTEIDKFKILNFGLKNGLVDVKVAAIDKDWSGHKFVYRKEDR